MAGTKKKNIAQSIRRRLSNVAVRQETLFQNILTSFLLERMAARLMKNPELAEKLIFKGGYVGLRVYESPRYTVDLDALVRGSPLERIVSIAKEEVQKSRGDAVWFTYEKEVDLVTLGEYGGIRLYFRAGIGDPPEDIKRAQSIHLDLAVGDPVIPTPVKTHTHSILGDDSLSWCVYTIESSIAEKLHTLIVRHSDNSRSKDVFDLYYLMPKCNHEILKQALSATFKSRGDPLPSDIPQVLNKIDKDLLKRGWKSAIAGLRERLDFDTIFEHVIKQCKNIFIG